MKVQRTSSRLSVLMLSSIHQIHRLEDGQIVVFSRNSENMSSKYPDLIESMSKVRLPTVHCLKT